MSNIKGTTLRAFLLTVNPAVAKKLLKESPINRSIQTNRVKALSHKQKSGEWIIAQPILLDKEGKLLDGHHRLRAVVDSETPVDFLAISGFERSQVFTQIDDTAPRRLKDWLKIQGEPLPDVMAAVILMAARDEAGRIPTSSGGVFLLTALEGCVFLESHPKIRDSVVGAPGMVNRMIPRSLCCFCHYKFAQKSRAEANSFFIDLVAGSNLKSGDPILLLRQRLFDNRLSKTRLTRTEMCALIYKTWNACRSGEKLQYLRWISAGPRSQRFPEVI